MRDPIYDDAYDDPEQPARRSPTVHVEALRPEQVKALLETYRNAVAAITEAIEKHLPTLECMNEMVVSQINHGCNAYIHLCAVELLAKAKSAAAAATKAKAIVASRVKQELERQDVDEFIAYGHKFKLVTKDRINVKVSMEPMVIEWLKSDPSTAGLVIETYSDAALLEHVQGILNSGNVPPDFISVFQQPDLSIRKLPPKKSK